MLGESFSGCIHALAKQKMPMSGAHVVLIYHPEQTVPASAGAWVSTVLKTAACGLPLKEEKRVKHRTGYEV
jgi:hypothetical protein